MNFIIQSFICVSLLQLIIQSSATTCPTSCLHLGTVNAATCSCDCLEAYEGTYCERAKGNCLSNQPTDCGTNLPVDFCIFDTIAVYCPHLCSSPVCTCGLDKCLNGGVFNAATCSCNCPTNYYGTVCENYSTCSTILTCANFGTFNPTTCACDCVSINFSGTRCEFLSLPCSLPDPTYCDAYAASACVSTNVVYSLCPRKCGRCVFTTIAATTTTLATTTVPTTTVPTTTVATTTVATTTVVTTTVTTTVSTTTAIVTITTQSTTTPQPLTESPTTTAATTTALGTTVATTAGQVTTTGAVTSCQPLTCQNGFTFNTGTCTCPCSTGFSGTLCETYNCNTSPTPDSLTNGLCNVLTCGTASVANTCPFKCLCGGTTAAPTTLAPTTLAPTTTVVTTTGAVTSCQPLTCQNGFTFNTGTCTCPCSTGFSGTLCETYNCNTSPTPDSLTNGLCNVLTCGTASVANTCPFKCLCGSTTAA